MRKLESAFLFSVVAVMVIGAGCNDEPDSVADESPSPAATWTSIPGETSPTPGVPSQTPMAMSPTPEVSSPTPLSGPTPTPTTDSDQDADGFTESDGDCDDTDPTIYPGASEVAYDGVDQDCTGGDLDDVDEDGFVGVQAGGDDCDDDHAGIHPGVAEVPYDGTDQDCSGKDLTDADGDGFDAEIVGGDDCDDWNPNSHPGAEEFEDDKDNDCDGEIDEALDTTDDDRDGQSEADGDCNDLDASVFMGAEEVPYDGIDQDCSGQDLNDVDGDGFVSDQVAGGNDCDDTRNDIHPGADENCDGVDNDCDGTADGGVTSTYYRDADGDGYGDLNAPLEACDLPDGYAQNATDCDDRNRSIHPDAAETCDGRDENCDGEADEGVPTRNYYPDSDEDGYGADIEAIAACGPPLDGYVNNNSDCNDEDASIHPGAKEACNGVDDDCDGQKDEGVLDVFFADTDDDGFGDGDSSARTCEMPEGYADNNDDCDDDDGSVHPGAVEVCNGTDDDCDGKIDDGALSIFYEDADGDGYGTPQNTQQACTAPDGYVSNASDCKDTDAGIHPDAVEVCNGIDEDCDTVADDGVNDTYFYDGDQDGFGTPEIQLESCAPPRGYVENDLDCDDEDPLVNPDRHELANGIDDDCDGEIDNGAVFRYCKEMKDNRPDTPSGIYQLYPLGPDEAPIRLYCDMETEGGGWTVLPLDFADDSLWDVSLSGSSCVELTELDTGLVNTIHRSNTSGWAYTNLKFLLPIPVSEVHFDELAHSTATTCNNMDLTYRESDIYVRQDYESWFFAAPDPEVPVGFVFGDAKSTPRYTCSSGSPPFCSMEYVNVTTTMTRTMTLTRTLVNFYMVAMQGCNSGLCSGSGERFRIEHVADADGVWTNGILVR